jgi:hypothetical protein
MPNSPNANTNHLLAASTRRSLLFCDAADADWRGADTSAIGHLLRPF